MDRRIFRVPVAQWEEIASQSSLRALAERSGKGLVNIKNLKFRGRAMLVTGVMYGGIEGSSIYGWWLVAESDYTGTQPITTVYHDNDAILAGTRERGDMTGLKVRWNGSIVVVQEKIEIHPTLPTVAISLAEAQAEDLKLRQEGGWRVLSTRTHMPIEWWLLNGHPVVEYEGRFRQRLLALYYRLGATIGAIGISSHGDLAQQLVLAERAPEQGLLLDTKLPLRAMQDVQLGFQF